MICKKCEGTGWVCENHQDVRWEQEDGSTCCGGAGANCDCNPGGFVDFEAVIATTNPDGVKTWAH